MGQYYKVINKTKKEWLCPHTFGNGLKLMEFVSDGKGVLQGLAILLAEGNGRGGGDLQSDNKLIGSWSGDEISIVGDYADSGLYDTATQNYRNISKETFKCLMEDHWLNAEAKKHIKEYGDKYLMSAELEVLEEVFPEELAEARKMAKATEVFRRKMEKVKNELKSNA
tara:strand:- start:64 stop:567 length:504 start_codon:yes stop_codon:yes gene_type:complete